MSHRLPAAALLAAIVLTPAFTPATARAQLERRALAFATAGAPSPALALFAGQDARTGNVAVRPELLAATDAERLVLLIEPIAGVAMEVELESAIDRNEGQIWVGRVVGQPYSRVHLRRVGASITGTLRTRDGIFQLLPDGAGRAAVLQVTAPPLPDHALVPPERFLGDRESAMRSPAAGLDLGAGHDALADEPTRIDLMVVMEREALRELPGLGGWLKQTIRNGVVDLNLALADSGVNAEFNLQAIKRERYPVTGSDSEFAYQMLDDLTDPNDALLRKSQRLRRKFGSDLVAVVMRRNQGLCGLAWIGGRRGRGVQSRDEAFGFSVTSWRCVASGTLAHEIGHNMGGQHAHSDPTSNRSGAYDESYGHKVVGKFHTVMAYSCEFCTSALLFSTPAVMVEDEPAGVASGPKAADNAAGFELDRNEIASFRECRRRCR